MSNPHPEPEATGSTEATATNYDEIDAGVRELVRYLNQQTFDTCDSGDGWKVGMECARNYPHVTVRVRREDLIDEAGRLLRAAERFGCEVTPIGEGGWSVQATYDPCNGRAFLDLCRIPPADGEAQPLRDAEGVVGRTEPVNQESGRTPPATPHGGTDTDRS